MKLCESIQLSEITKYKLNFHFHGELLCLRITHLCLVM